MKIVTWNIQGMAPKWRARRRVIVETLRAERPDVIALQECAWRLRPQSIQIARPLGMRAVIAGTLGLAGRARPARISRMLPARARGGSNRVLIGTIDDIDVWSVHLPLDRGVRLRCAHAFVEWADVSGRPAVLCGDFNERAEEDAMTYLREHGFVDAWTDPSPGLTWSIEAPRARIDFVLARGVRVTSARVLDAVASDHFPLVVEIDT